MIDLPAQKVHEDKMFHFHDLESDEDGLTGQNPEVIEPQRYRTLKEKT